jgi:nitrogen fixation protein NifQ
MAMALQCQDERERIYAQLITLRKNTANNDYLACIIASWCAGEGVLPDYLGLERDAFAQLRNSFSPYFTLPEQAVSGVRLDFSRMLEKDDLTNLLNSYRRTDSPETDWIICIIVAACLGNDHLWQDLGLWSRTQLSALLNHNFPELAAKNTQDMKWKKFLYKQLCEAEGLHLCRAPSCSVCIDYPKCFGSED